MIISVWSSVSFVKFSSCKIWYESIYKQVFEHSNISLWNFFLFEKFAVNLPNYLHWHKFICCWSRIFNSQLGETIMWLSICEVHRLLRKNWQGFKDFKLLFTQGSYAWFEWYRPDSDMHSQKHFTWKNYLCQILLTKKNEKFFFKPFCSPLRTWFL